MPGKDKTYTSQLISTIIDSTDNHCYSPLHTASQKGHTAIVVALVEEGANVNIKAGENEDTPLMLTVKLMCYSAFRKYRSHR